MPLKLRAEGLTDVGRKRKNNEDYFSVEPKLGLYIVADGMGGHASGEIASRMAVETLRSFFIETERDQDKTWPYKMNKALSYEENRLIVGIKLANKLIYSKAQSDIRLRGMGTTIVAMSTLDDIAYIAHVGDSRVYRLRDDKFEQLTEDHSLLNDYKKLKKLTPEEIENFPHKNVIVRALGMKDTVQVDLRTEELRAGDLFLLCSDGLSGMLSDEEMYNIVREHRKNLKKTCQILVEEANNKGGHDNITVVLVEVVEG